ncbi:MAG: hypothetical protein HYZ39_19770 [Mycolicibacterium cosmeticum]|nr:hypothetical protein [Mycolicibacterium cosmeticum]
MPHRSRAVLSAAIVTMAALGLSGCAEETVPPEPTAATISTVASAPAAPAQAPLPAPEALTDVLARMADPSIPGDQKLGLVQFASPDDAAALDRFTKAIVDGGHAPLAFRATDLKWTQQGDVTATVDIASADPASQATAFTFPMQFSPIDNAWQLSRESANQLLLLGHQR